MEYNNIDVNTYFIVIYMQYLTQRPRFYLTQRPRSTRYT